MRGRADMAWLVSAGDRGAVREPDLLRVSRALFNAGLFLSSLLAFRSVGGVTVGDLFLLASALTLLMSSAGQRLVQTTPQLHVAVALVIIAGIAAAGRSVSPSADLAVIVRLVFLVAVLPWQARALLPTPRALAHSASLWVAGAAVCGAGTLLQARFGSGIIPGAAVTNSGRFSGLAQTVSDTGGITAVALAFCLGGLSIRSSKSQRLLSQICLAAAGVGLLLSGSVSGMLSAVSAGVYLVLRRGITPRRVVGMAVVALVVLQLAGSIQHRTNGALSPLERVEQVSGLATFTTAQAGLNTSQSRLDTDREGLHEFIEHPLVGAGLDPASGVVDQRDQLAVHNLVIGAAYQGGILLVIGICIPVGMALRRAWRLAGQSALNTQISAALAATVVFAFTAPSDYNRYFWIPVALVMAASDMDFRRDVPMSTEVIERAARGRVAATV